MVGGRENHFHELEKNLGIAMCDLALLENALTHSSYANEKKNKGAKSNERLEFLGDSMLSIVITEHLYRTYPHLPEGELTKARSLLVCEDSLARLAKELDLNEYILLGKGERLSGGQNRDSILADAMEALIGAVFIDNGFEAAKSFVLKYMQKEIERYVKGKVLKDYKSILQEMVQKKDHSAVYEVLLEKGPAHNKMFTVCVRVQDRVFGKGIGKTKKEAEQQAAKVAYEELNQSGIYS
jgi:ribonuclease III